jgi:hypothetical protein
VAETLATEVSSNWLACQNLGPLARGYEPLCAGAEKLWRFDQPEKVALADQDIKFRWAVPPVVAVVKVHP